MAIIAYSIETIAQDVWRESAEAAVRIPTIPATVSGGVYRYFCFNSLPSTKSLTSNSESSSASTTAPTLTPSSSFISESSDAPKTPTNSSASLWKSAAEQVCNEKIPLIVSDPENPREIKNESAALDQALARARQLPTTWKFYCNHIIVNKERTDRFVAPLIRLCELDHIARLHVERMAASSSLFQFASPDEIKSKFQRPCRRLGVNLAKGEDVRDIFKAQMDDCADQANILDRRYTHMGMATAVGPDGLAYLCQIFRG